MKIYKREIVHYPYRSWTEYYTNKELADKAYEVADASKELYVHDAGTTETDDLELYFYSRISNEHDCNNSPEQIRSKIGIKE